MAWTDEPLPLDIEPPKARPTLDVQPAAVRAKRSKPQYRRLHLAVSRTCDDCLAYTIKHYPNDPTPLPANYERRIRGEGAIYLCYQHAQQRRKADGLEPR
jgi:hypothetical protein